MRTQKYEEMFPDEFLSAVEKMPVFFVPSGLLEWHGDHLPLGLDSFKAHGVCMKCAERFGAGIVMPPVYFGRPGYSRYAGTMTYSEPCIDLLFTELFYQLKKVGARIIILITGHSGECQDITIRRSADYFMRDNPDIKIIAMPEGEGIYVEGAIPDHAGRWETSLLWYLNPDLVNMDRFKIHTSKKYVYKNPPNDYYKEEEEWVWGEDLRETASRELGKKCVDAIAENVCGLINNAIKELGL